MARAAVVLDDVVVNVIEAEQDYELPDEQGELVWLEEGGYVGPGFTRGPGGEWLAPGVVDAPEPEPDPLEQLRADLDWIINYVVTGEA